MIRGRFGDTHVAPAPLLDVGDAHASPPADSHEVQFRIPLSLSAMLDGMARAGLDEDVAAWGTAYTQLVQDQVLRRVQEACGYAADPARPDVGRPARLELAAVVEAAVPGIDATRWHCHVYIGSTACVLATGERFPVYVPQIERGVFGLAHSFHNADVRELAEREFGVTWGDPGPTATVEEIVDPPWHEHVDPSAVRGVCLGPWEVQGVRVVADEESLRVAAEQEGFLRAELERRESEPEPSPPTLMERYAELLGDAAVSPRSR
ncbi:MULTISPECIES: hypothetical protein [Pseudonocardia]|mgnify:CR=1 FL=1|jgi:hypothetical protein|uniref:hypothetical protein n=1 Tax=Pseudonocardia TaxID=1847 RepID=UPI002096D4EB|nr:MULTISPECIES: hypothetical protein [Pseudonocardia]MCO7192166.1 hypothetical protein [Pseudonocardia sp. McavD-2-B]WFG47316.1 hypothetical protein PaSha_28075 [Pseudonocardia alni]